MEIYKSRIRIYAKKADFVKIGQQFQIDPVIARILRNRELTEPQRLEQFLHGTVEKMSDPHLLKDMEKTAQILRRKVQEHKKIRIIGDYDADGICSTTILLMKLERMGANVDYRVPNRITDGYGINEELVEQAVAEGCDTILTCDNGIAARDQVAYAKKLGLTVLITDHHDIPFVRKEDGTREYLLPPADAVVDAKQPDCTYPFKELCGAGIAWKLTEMLGNTPEERDDYLNLMAIATVTDVVSLTGENRVAVRYGLEHMHSTRIIGLQALLHACGQSGRPLTSYTFGFILGPCLNASGRLAVADQAIALLMEQEYDKAYQMALSLCQLNEERKEMTEKQKEIAIQAALQYEAPMDQVLVLYLPDCHESIAGIVAGKVRECYYRPTIVLTRAAGQPGEAKGSARSIDSYNMFEKLTECSELLDKFGGHPMAAGMSLQEDRIGEFREALNRQAGLGRNELTPTIWIDVPMPVDYISLSLLDQLEELAPFGKDNEKPLFADRNLIVRSVGLVGKERNVLRMKLESAQGRIFTAICFQVDSNSVTLPRAGERIHILYYPERNEFRGNVSIQLHLQTWIPVQTSH